MPQANRYHALPYHSFAHGFSTMQSSFWVLTQTKLGRNLSQLHKFSLLIAAIVHDCGPSSCDYVPGLPHVCVILTEALVSYQDYHMCVLS